VPANTTAEVWIPASGPDTVSHTGAAFLRTEDGCSVYRVGSGSHRFTT
jgi:alpha-L-rhamnosidase